MAGFVTHYLYGVDLYKSLQNRSLKRIIHEYPHAYRLGLQGPDIFFYHVTYLRYDDFRNIGSHMHEHQINKFFENGFKHICGQVQDTHKHQIKHHSNLSESEKMIILSYLCGMIAHHTLDAQIHPYIYSKCNHKPGKNNRLTVGYHLLLETEIDRELLLQKKGLAMTKFSQADTFSLPLAQVFTISRFLSEVIAETYAEEFNQQKFKISPYTIRQTLMESFIYSKLLRDPHGYKKNLTLFVEKNILHYDIFSGKFITDCATPMGDIMNTEHKTFKNPWDPTQKSHQSVIELYDKAAKKCKQIFDKITPANILLETISQVEFDNILNEIGDLSYHSGLPEA